MAIVHSASGFGANIALSYRLTIASLRLVFEHKTVLLLPVCTLLAVTALVVVPLALLIWGLKYEPQTTTNVLELLFYFAVQAAKAENWNLAISVGIVHAYLLWSLWMIPVLTAVLYFSTVGMHVATQQIRREEPRLSAAFAVANANYWRIVGLAVFNATVYAWINYALTYVLRAIPFAGRWLLAGVRLVLSALTYLMLPIVIYERAGAREAMRSAWQQVKRTWSGVLVGSGLMFFALFCLFEVFAWGVAQRVLDVTTVGILSLVAAAVLYAIANAVSAALRAVLYWYAATGELPPGFEDRDLPEIAEHRPFTATAESA